MVLPEEVISGISDGSFLPIMEPGSFIGYLDLESGKTFRVAVQTEEKSRSGFPIAQVYESKNMEAPVYATLKPEAQLYTGPGKDYSLIPANISEKGRHKVLKTWQDV
jgi:hypothetical protein